MAPLDWKLNEHCLLLVGYDDQHYWFNDPWHNHGLCRQPKALAWRNATARRICTR